MQRRKVGEATASLRRVYLHLVDATDGLTPETGEAGGAPQISYNGGAFANTAGVLVHVANGLYYVELNNTTELIAANKGQAAVRYKGAATAEAQVLVEFVDTDPFTLDKTGYSLTATERDEVAKALLRLDWVGLTGEAAFSVLNALRFLRNKRDISADQLTIRKEDGSSTAWQAGTVGSDTAKPIISITPVP